VGVKTGALLILTLVGCGLSVPKVALADSITHFAIENVGGSVVINANHTLTGDDLATLAARDDNGLHLGWFRRNRRQPVATETGVDLAVGVGAGSGNQAASSPTTSNPQSAGNALAVPEPAILLLTGAGLLSLAHRMRRGHRRFRA
jgi:hypothetical protein